MADIDILRPHALGIDGARRAAERVAERLRADYGVETEWQGNVLHVSGRGVDGQLDAQPEAVRVRAQLGLLVRPFRRQLVREIERELDRAALLPAPR